MNGVQGGDRSRGRERSRGTGELTCLRMYVRVTGQRALNPSLWGLDFSISAFVMLPIMKSVVSNKDEQNAILEQRKREIKETINRRIIKTEKQA